MSPFVDLIRGCLPGFEHSSANWSMKQFGCAGGAMARLASRMLSSGDQTDNRGHATKNDTIKKHLLPEI
jgi:hypothetical protein